MAKEKVIFVDRDGTLIEEKHYLSKLDQIAFYPGVAESLKKLKSAGFKTIVITNQSGVAKGLFPEGFVNEAFREMNRILSNDQVQLDDQFYCPHRIEAKIKKYDIACDCRKPNTGMIEKALEKYSVDLANSFMIGDKYCDVKLGQNMNLKNYLVLTGHGEDERHTIEQKLPKTKIVKSFSDAAEDILNSIQI